MKNYAKAFSYCIALATAASLGVFFAMSSADSHGGASGKHRIGLPGAQFHWLSDERITYGFTSGIHAGNLIFPSAWEDEAETAADHVDDHTFVPELRKEPYGLWHNGVETHTFNNVQTGRYVAVVLASPGTGHYTTSIITIP